MLYLIATPIGNLGDITLRALEVMNICDYLLCEDTRHSRILLSHYKISKPLKSFHAHNESKMHERILKDLDQGKTIGLLSDAGTPGISDPGTKLVIACRQLKKQVIAIPGPCAAIVALSASGLSTAQFQFLGFLPRKKGKLENTLITILAYPGTTVCYESPHRIRKTLELLATLEPTRPVVIARELTKKFEEYRTGTAQELAHHFTETAPKGEFVLMIS